MARIWYTPLYVRLENKYADLNFRDQIQKDKYFISSQKNDFDFDER